MGYTDGMRIYFSGVGGVGIGPLMQIARDAGYDVVGSDQNENMMTKQLVNSGMTVYIGQDGSQVARAQADSPIDWFVYTAALPSDHPELTFAQNNGIRASKRDEFLAELLRAKGQKLIAVSGTHGKTTTTGMLVWTMKQLGIPVSYSVGTTLSFGPSGYYDQVSEYFVYECDEFDRNFLHFEPFLSIITSIDHDHFDTYPTPLEYHDAFVQFIEQSGYSLLWEKDLRALGKPDISANYEAYDELMDLSDIKLAGDHNRQNAFLVRKALERLLGGNGDSEIGNRILRAINSFPGTGRRFEKLAENLYSDYGHHPAEIVATLEMAREISEYVVLVYQPHQNIRQHELRDQYRDQFELADKIYWLPTYLSREDPSLEILTPEQLYENTTNRDAFEKAEMDDALWQAIQDYRDEGRLVLCMGAGSIDGWVRQHT